MASEAATKTKGEQRPAKEFSSKEHEGDVQEEELLAKTERGNKP